MITMVSTTMSMVIMPGGMVMLMLPIMAGSGTDRGSVRPGVGRQ